MSDDKWRGYIVGIEGDPIRSDVARVVFYPRGLMAERGPGGDPPRVPTPAVVIVQKGCKAENIEYRPPEVENPNLQRDDYIQKALHEAQRKMERRW